jgi:tetratricopeptide (TPR) repeat protein
MASRHSPSPWAKKKVSLHTIIKEATVSLAGKSDSVEKLLVRATAYMRQGDLTPQGLIYFNKAVEDYTHVIRVAEADGEAVREATFNRGKAHQQLSMVEEAIHDFDTVLSLDASPSWVTVNAGNRLFLSLDYFNRLILLLAFSW